jgi:hypothetical protein
MVPVAIGIKFTLIDTSKNEQTPICIQQMMNGGVVFKLDT